MLRSEAAVAVMVVCLLGGCRDADANQEQEWGPNLGAAWIEAPLRVGCGTALISRACQAADANATRQLARAMSGDIMAQREIAATFYADEAFNRRPIQACAWRIVVEANPLASASDEAAKDDACSNLSFRDRRAAQWLADDIYLELEDTHLPEDAWKS